MYLVSKKGSFPCLRPGAVSSRGLFPARGCFRGPVTILKGLFPTKACSTEWRFPFKALFLPRACSSTRFGWPAYFPGSCVMKTDQQKYYVEDLVGKKQQALTRAAVFGLAIRVPPEIRGMLADHLGEECLRLLRQFSDQNSPRRQAHPEISGRRTGF